MYCICVVISKEGKGMHRKQSALGRLVPLLKADHTMLIASNWHLNIILIKLSNYQLCKHIVFSTTKPNFNRFKSL